MELIYFTVKIFFFLIVIMILDSECSENVFVYKNKHFTFQLFNKLTSAISSQTK